MSIRAKNLARDWRLDPPRTFQRIREALDLGREGEPGGIRPEEFSLRDLAEELIFDRHGEPCGHRVVKEVLAPDGPTGNRFLEATSGVDSTVFANITGQLIVNKVLEGFQREEFIGTRLVPTQPTKLDGEKIPGISRTSDGGDRLTVGEGQAYPAFGFGEEYVETPSTTKRGLIVPVTKEAIFFDRTGLVLRRAAEVGEVLGLNKEKRILDVITGATDDIYKYNGTTYQTFYSQTDSAGWTNHLDGNELVDWNDIDEAEQLFAEMTDPATGEPVILGIGRVLLVTPYNAMVANRILSATETRSGTGNVVVAGNPLSQMGIRLEVSRLMYRRVLAMVGGSGNESTAREYWFYGDPSKAFAYMENWPITVVQSATNSEAEFTQDVVLRYKASERGAAAVLQPRAWTRHRKLTTSSSSGA